MCFYNLITLLHPLWLVISIQFFLPIFSAELTEKDTPNVDIGRYQIVTVAVGILSGLAKPYRCRLILQTIELCIHSRPHSIYIYIYCMCMHVAPAILRTIIVITWMVARIQLSYLRWTNWIHRSYVAWTRIRCDKVRTQGHGYLHLFWCVIMYFGVPMVCSIHVRYMAQIFGVSVLLL